MTWQLAEAKNKFSEVFDKALAEGPQEISRRGKQRVYLVSAEEYERLHGGRKQSLTEFLLNAPSLDGLDLERDKDTGRDIDW